MSARIAVGFAMVCLAAVLVVRADDDPPPKKIRPEEARDHLGEKVSVTFLVQASKDAVKRKVVYLDSEKDFHDRKNLGIILPEELVSKLVQQNGQHPASYYKDRTIRVVGKVVEEESRCYIRLSEPDQIEVVEPERK